MHFFAIKVGAQGLVGRSSYIFLREIGLPGRDVNKVKERMSKAAEIGCGQNETVNSVSP